MDIVRLYPCEECGRDMALMAPPPAGVMPGFCSKGCEDLYRAEMRAARELAARREMYLAATLEAGRAERRQPCGA